MAQLATFVAAPALVAATPTITALDFLKGNGELLFYPNNPDLCKTVITRPMDLVRSLRTVISHKTVGHFKKAQFQHKKLELLQKGLLSYEDFRSIYQSGPTSESLH